MIKSCILKNRTEVLVLAISAALLSLTQSGCGLQNFEDQDDGRPLVAASFTIIADFAERVAGDHIRITTLAPAGAEVHEWELSPRNFMDLEGADLVFTNGLGLEQWLGQLEATVATGVAIIPLAEESAWATLPIRFGDREGNPDPHLWMDPRAASSYVEVIRDRLIELHPDHADAFRENARAFLDELDALHRELEESFSRIPEGRRVLITSEAAFLYFADAYGFRHDGIWGSNAEEEGTPRQIARIIDLIRDEQPAALFWESTISDRYVRSVADETGTPVAGPLYVDSIGRSGSGAETYLDLMRANARVIVEALTE